MVKKQNLLVISPTIPNKNLSAGDYRVYCLIKTLSKYFNIFFISTDNQTIIKDVILNKYIKKTLKNTNSIKTFKIYLEQNKIDYCLFERYFNLPFDICKFMPLTKSIVDVHEIGFIKTQELSKIQKIDNNITKVFKAKELLFYKNAKILICISKKEKDILQQYFPTKKIVVIPTCTDIYKTIKDFKNRKDICFFGFFKHQPNEDAINYFLKKIFPKITKNLPDIKFYILGNGSSIFKNKYHNVFVKENIQNISKELCKYKVFVCPLRYGAGLKKKTLDAMASKTPIVSTEFGLEGIKNIDKKYFKINSKEFVNKVIELYTNKTVWQKESKNNFNIVNKYYSKNKFNIDMNLLIKIIGEI